MKNFKTHTIDKCYHEKHLEFFTEFFVHILRQKRGLKWKKRDFNILKLYSTRFWEFQATDFDV